MSLISYILQLQVSSHPYITNIVSAAIVVTLIAIALQFAYALIRRKFTDMNRLSAIMKEITEFRKKYIEAIKTQDKEALEELNKKKPYIDRLSIEMFNMNTKPLIIFMIPMLIIWIYLLPNLIGNTAAISPIPLNPFGDLMPLTCSKSMIVHDINDINNYILKKVDEINNPQITLSVKSMIEGSKRALEEGKYGESKEFISKAYSLLNSVSNTKIEEKVPRCIVENEVLLWAWYFIVSIAFSGIIMRITKTNIS